ncbi:MAG: tRNA pseudouridine(55) synthase TruB, partial [Anaerolineae bacterium]|nr:tRNA pseudouridine(55) synthase TruB [Anaerolineae bacterium]
ILLDAPCSGDTLRLHKGNKKRDVSASEQQRLQQRQITLLTAAYEALKPGGEVVYSTCTLSPDENEAVLDALLHRYPAAVEAVTHLPFGENACGLTTNGEQVYDPQIKNAIRLWPHLYRTSGFFAARLRKHEATPPTKPVPEQGHPRTRFTSEQIIFDTLQQQYGFDFYPLAGGLTFWQHDDSIYAIPEAVLEHFGTLPHISAGFLFGQWMDKKFIPSHELITRFETQFVQPRFTLSDTQKKIWMEGREIRDISLPSDLVLLQDEQGRFLGRGKVSGGRIRNLLPKRFIS